MYALYDSLGLRRNNYRVIQKSGVIAVRSENGSTSTCVFLGIFSFFSCLLLLLLLFVLFFFPFLFFFMSIVEIAAVWLLTVARSIHSNYNNG